MAMIEINWTPTLKDLRQFAWICLVGFPLAGFVLWWRFDLWIVPVVLWTLGPVVCLLGQISPAAVKPVYVGLSLITFPIGFVVSHIVLGLTFYVLISGIGLIFRLMGRDSMTRKFDKSAKTYWIRRKPITDMGRYFRQF